MERKIGEIFKYNGDWYQCIEGKTICDECDLRNIICQRDTNTNNPFKRCSGNYRTDKRTIIFKKLEKVGEPYKHNGRIFQAYRTCEVPIFTTENYANFRELGNDSKISIEIKQNNMEEKNLKPFDLEAAKAGKPVCTRDGRKARIICFDVKGNFPMAVAVELEEDIEIIYTFHLNGRADPKGNRNNDLDLMMLPEKKEGWVNIYDDMVIYESEEEAKIGIATARNYIATTKVEWEE